MKYLNREQEAAIRSVAMLEGESSNRDAVEKAVATDCLKSLKEMGYIDYAHSDPERGAIDRVELLNPGRCYFDEKRRDRFRRWAPVLASAAIGVAGTLLGVIVTLLLS